MWDNTTLTEGCVQTWNSCRLSWMSLGKGRILSGSSSLITFCKQKLFKILQHVSQNTYRNSSLSYHFSELLQDLQVEFEEEAESQRATKLHFSSRSRRREVQLIQEDVVGPA